jgi:hypothetical protein
MSSGVISKSRPGILGGCRREKSVTKDGKSGGDSERQRALIATVVACVSNVEFKLLLSAGACPPG